MTFVGIGLKEEIFPEDDVLETLSCILGRRLVGESFMVALI